MPMKIVLLTEAQLEYVQNVLRIEQESADQEGKRKLFDAIEEILDACDNADDQGGM